MNKVLIYNGREQRDFGECMGYSPGSKLFPVCFFHLHQYTKQATSVVYEPDVQVSEVGMAYVRNTLSQVLGTLPFDVVVNYINAGRKTYLTVRLVAKKKGDLRKHKDLVVIVLSLFRYLEEFAADLEEVYPTLEELYADPMERIIRVGIALANMGNSNHTPLAGQFGIKGAAMIAEWRGTKLSDHYKYVKGNYMTACLGLDETCCIGDWETYTAAVAIEKARKVK